MRTVEILVGPSGSGKSTWAANQTAATVVSADHFFEMRGGYRFDPAKLGEAHAQCMLRFVEAMVRGVGRSDEMVIVDNTNTTPIEVAPYYAVAKAFRCRVVIRRFNGDHENRHGVPPNAVEAQRARIRRFEIPPFWDVVQVQGGGA